MKRYLLQIKLISDTTFGRGDGLAGLVDQEIEHDAATGLPYLRGRTLKGLLSEECDTIVASLLGKYDWNPTLQRLFGRGGSTTNTAANWHFSDALLPADLRAAIAAQLHTDRRLTPAMILESLTTIRRQTAIDIKSGTPDEGSLRAARVVRHGLTFTSLLQTSHEHADDLHLLAAGVLALRRLGSGRNRGRGAVHCTLLTDEDPPVDITASQLQCFKEAIA